MKADDISPGQWVAVIECPAAPVGVTFDFCGKPLFVKAVSLPFVAVECGDEIQSIDTRFWELGRISEEYANAMLNLCPEEEPQKDASACPRCGAHLTSRKLEDGWHRWCGECQFVEEACLP